MPRSFVPLLVDRRPPVQDAPLWLSGEPSGRAAQRLRLVVAPLVLVAAVVAAYWVVARLGLARLPRRPIGPCSALRSARAVGHAALAAL